MAVIHLKLEKRLKHERKYQINRWYIVRILRIHWSCLCNILSSYIDYVVIGGGLMEFENFDLETFVMFLEAEAEQSRIVLDEKLWICVLSLY